VFAAMRDKDLAGVFAPFLASVERWFVTQANADRGASTAALAEILEARGARSVECCADVAAACGAARIAARPGDRVLVFGSFHTVGAATAALGLYCAPSRLGDQPARWTRV
jgi:dihydrofolate synthase/folylpolyglutamate synthase